MLACLGGVIFDVITDLQSIDTETSSSIAQHDVIGSGPVYEITGDEEATISLRGVLHPAFMAEAAGANALIGVNALELARTAKIPLPLLRGNFVPEGWVIIKSISRSDSDLDASGVGTQVEYQIKLLKVGTPTASAAASILRLFL